MRLPQARIDVFSRPPPANRRRALVDLRRAKRRGGVRFLRFGKALEGRFHIEDDRGVRYSDFNKESGSAFDVVVSAGRSYFVRHDEREEVEIRASAPRRVDLRRSLWSPTAVSARGAVDQSFRQDLYQVAYGPRFYEGYVARSGDTPVEERGPAVALGAEAQQMRPRHSLLFGYTLSGAPAGQTGLSQGGDLRYAFQLKSWLDLGVAVQLGAGSGGAGGAASAQELTRTAVMGTAGFSTFFGSRLWARLDAALGWQLFSGTLNVGGSRVTGNEGRGLRFEFGAALGLDVLYHLAFVVRGGLALDGVYSAEASASTQLSGLLTAGALVRW